MQVIRANKESLIAVLEAFIYDPLLSWKLVEVGVCFRTPTPRLISVFMIMIGEGR